MTKKSLRSLLPMVLLLGLSITACEVMPNKEVLSTTSSNKPITATARLIDAYDGQGIKRNAMLFFNNTNDYVRASSNIKQHDANGSFLSESTITSQPIPPKSYSAVILTEVSVNGLTGDNLHLESFPSEQFVNMQLTNLRLEPNNPRILQSMNKRTKPPTMILAGTLTNIDKVKPSSITVQVFSGDNLTLVSNDHPYLSSEFVTEFATWDKPYLSIQVYSPMPPPNERINFYLPLWEDISIKNAEQATIDGRITILASK